MGHAPYPGKNWSRPGRALPVCDGTLCMVTRIVTQVVVDRVSWTVFAALRITSKTKPGWESIGTWLLSVSKVVAPMRLATKRCSSGWTVRSSFATMYQLRFDSHAVPWTFWAKRSAAGAACVAQTTLYFPWAWAIWPTSLAQAMSMAP
jgi:hypothetical protein